MKFLDSITIEEAEKELKIIQENGKDLAIQRSIISNKIAINEKRYLFLKSLIALKKGE